MSGIINALFGSHHKDEKKNTETAATKTTVSSSTASGSSIGHTAISDDVRVNSVVSTETRSKVSMENTQKIADLMSKLGTTHNQIDIYSKKRNAEISDAVAAAIDKVVADTASQQQTLLADANLRSAAIEDEHRQRLQARVTELDNEKAVLLAELERTLNARQDAILLKAKQDIDAVQRVANEQKMAVLRQAQAQTNVQIDQITEKVADLAAEDAQRRLQSTTTTVITTKSEASGETHSPVTGVATSTTTKTNESHQSYQSSSHH